MGNRLIIKDKIKQLRKGYPTVSDKYNVAGGILQNNSADVPFGELVAYGDTVGYYKPATSLTDVGNVAGIVLATNVKLSGVWPDDGSEATVVVAKEAFNLLLSGYTAVALDSGFTTAQAAAGKQAAIILATGKLTTIDKVAAGTIVALPGYYFTGLVEDSIAEIEVRR